MAIGDADKEESGQKVSPCHMKSLPFTLKIMGCLCEGDKLICREVL